MSGFSALLLVCGKAPGVGMLFEAESIGMTLLSTRLTMYQSCGRLYAEGLAVVQEYDVNGRTL
jgi:hypothetical protein